MALQIADTPHMAFVRQASLTPDLPAVIGKDEQLSYAELDRLSNQIANTLLANGIGNGTRVGLLTFRTPRMLAGLLGIVKAGAVYVPVDPEFAADRVRYILEHAEVEALVTEAAVITGTYPESCFCAIPRWQRSGRCCSWMTATPTQRSNPNGFLIAGSAEVHWPRRRSRCPRSSSDRRTAW